MAATAATSFAGAAEVALAVATPVEVTVPVARSGLVVVGVVVLLVIAFAAVAVVVPERKKSPFKALRNMRSPEDDVFVDSRSVPWHWPDG